MNAARQKSDFLIFPEYKFNGPLSFCTAQDNSLIVVDELDHSVLSFGINGKLLWKIRENENGETIFKYPSDCTVGNDCLWVTDRYNHRIVKVSLDGRIVSSFGKHGNTSDCLEEPFGIFSDSENLYVADSGNRKIKIFSFSGKLLDEFGDPGPDAEYYSSSEFKNLTVFRRWMASQTRFNTIETMFYKSGFTIGNLEFPKGLAVSGEDIIVADNAGKIRFFDKSGNFKNTVRSPKLCNWVDVFEGIVYFSCEFSKVLYRINHEGEAEEWLKTEHEADRFRVSSDRVTYISPWERKIYYVELY